MSEPRIPPRRVLVIGGGIAGPALALFLKQIGFEPHLFEAHRPVEGAGGGLNIAPNGMAVLQAIGVADAVRAVGTPLTRTRLVTTRGTTITEFGTVRHGQGTQQSTTLSRAALQRVLLREIDRQGIPMRVEKELVAIENDGADGIVARFADGDWAVGNLLVGADGLHSRVRRAILPRAPEPHFTGLLTVGGMLPRDFLGRPSPEAETAMELTVAPGGFFGTVYGDQQSDKGLFWWSTLARAEPLPRSANGYEQDEAIREQLLAVHRGWHAPIERLVRETPRFLTLNIYDVPSLPRWTEGRAVLIGDAAHAMGPHAGQGASVALEDAMYLAKLLRDAPENLAMALRRFERERRPRAERIVAIARANGERKKPSGLLPRLANGLLLPLQIMKARRDMAWMADYRIDWAA